MKDSKRNSQVESGTSKGYLYVLSNPAMPGILKIGYTTRSPQVRCDEISKGTGVPGKFNVAHAVQVIDSPGAEKWVHQQLRAYRYSRDREFFKLDLAHAQMVIDAAAEKFAIKPRSSAELSPAPKKYGVEIPVQPSSERTSPKAYLSALYFTLGLSKFLLSLVWVGGLSLLPLLSSQSSLGP